MSFLPYSTEIAHQVNVYFTTDLTPPTTDPSAKFRPGDLLLYVGVTAAGLGWRVSAISGTTVTWSTLHAQAVSSTLLSGATDAVPPHASASYLVTTAGVDAMTLAAPTATVDDGVTITITSQTANAHTLTATGLLQTGSSAVNLATFAAFAGAGLTLRAYQGKWIVASSVGITFT